MILSLFGSPQLFGQTRTKKTISGWEIDQPVIYQATQLTKGHYALEASRDDVARSGYLATPVTAEQNIGDLGGITVNDVLPSGRYRLNFEVNAQEFQQGELFAVVDVNAARKLTFRSRVTPVDFTAAGFVNHTVEFYVPPGRVKNIEAKMRWEAPIKASSFRLKSVTITRITGPQFIGNMQTSKVLYQPGESGSVHVNVINGDVKKSQLKLVLSEETWLDQKVELHSQEITIAAFENLSIDLPLIAGRQPFGRTYWVELQKDGTAIDGAADVASVSDHMWYVAIGAFQEGILHSTGNYQDSAIPQWIQTARADYANWMEKSFWAPDDWGDLTPAQDEWVSGQAFRYENKDRLKKLIASAHQQGIRAISYGKGSSGGTAGLEIARRHPDWVLSDRFNVPLGSAIDTWDFDHWDEIPFHLQHAKDYKSPWFYVKPDLRQIEVLDHGIEELISSSKQFGWDGVRFDGHFSAGNDALSTWNMQRMKQRLLKANSQYLFGYNIGCPLQYADRIPQEIQEAAAGGGHWMNEGINQWAQAGTGNVYSSWRQYAEQESHSAEIIRQLGGTYHFIYGLGNHTAVQSLYKFAIGTAAGVHPVYGEQRQATGCKNWGSFLTRWSCLFWHPGLRLLNAQETLIKANSRMPVWDWMADEMVIDPTRRLVITHLFNPPSSDDIRFDSAQSIEPVTDLTIQLKLGRNEKLNSLYFVRPTGLDAIKLDVQNVKAIPLPALHSWGIVVADLSGTYVPWTPKPAFTSPPDPELVAAGRKDLGTVSPADPLHPEESRDARSSSWFSEAENVKWSMKQTPRIDPEASAGMAASYDGQMKNGVAGCYFSDVLPGRYKVTARIKTVNPSPKTQILFHTYAEIQKEHLQKSLKATDFANHYRDANLEVSYYGNRFITVIVQGTVTNPDEVVLLDCVRLDLEEQFSDAQLMDELKDKPSPISKVGPASKVLVLNGLHHELLHVEECLQKVWSTPEITSLYQRDLPEKQTLSDFGTLVLVNYSLPPLAMRAAIRDWVQQGGHLIIFGGRYTLAEGKWEKTFLDELLPGKLKAAPDLIALPQGSIIRDGSHQVNRGMTVYYAHDVTPLPDTKVVWWAGQLPILQQRKIGKGQVSLFSGTVLGQRQKSEVPFWQSNEWVDELAKVLK